jgi:HPt (histidine-containing phosphotransfer) domain-containing protein
LTGEQLAAIDWTVLEGLPPATRPGEPALRVRLIGLYLDASRPLVRQLQAAVGRGDAAATASSAHPLKSSSANVGARMLAELCGQLEHDARQSALQNATALLARIEAEYLRVSAALESDLASRLPVPMRA